MSNEVRVYRDVTGQLAYGVGEELYLFPYTEVDESLIGVLKGGVKYCPSHPEAIESLFPEGLEAYLEGVY